MRAGYGSALLGGASEPHSFVPQAAARGKASRERLEAATSCSVRDGQARTPQLCPTLSSPSLVCHAATCGCFLKGDRHRGPGFRERCHPCEFATEPPECADRRSVAEDACELP